MALPKVIELGGRKYSGDALRAISESEAIATYRSKFDVNQIRNAWKQANGKSVRNYSESEGEAPKPKRKRTTKKKTDK